MDSNANNTDLALSYYNIIKTKVQKNQLRGVRLEENPSRSIHRMHFFVGSILFLSRYSEQVLENLKGYSARLEDNGFTVKAKLLSDVNFDVKHEWHFFSDFRSFAKQMNITTIYYDQSINGLYFSAPISPTNNGIETNIFYYNKVF